MTEELDRSAALIEQLLGDPALRCRFRADPAVVLKEHGLPELASGLGRGERALLTLELRESRSSLAGVMVAAAAEGVDFTHIAERAAPRLEHGARQVVDRLVDGNGRHHPHERPAAAHPAAKPAPPSIGSQTALPPMASSAPAHAAVAAEHAQGSGGGSQPGPGQQPAGAGGQRGTAAGAGQPPASPGGQRGAAAGAGQPPASPGSGGASEQPPADAQGTSGTSQPAGTGHSSAAAGQQPAPSGQQPAPSGPPSGQQPAPSGQQPAPHNHAPDPAPGGPPASPPADIGSYPGNDASQQQLAAWMGAQAKAAGLPPELPVMAALTESTLRNIPYGDRDSVGFFQMRLSIWNSGPYAGYLDNPELQMKWFIDHALAARAQDPALAQSPSTWGQWIANVEQPAAEYRYRYQLQLGTAQELLHGAALNQASAPGAPAGTAAPGTPAAPTDSAAAGAAAAPAPAAPAVQIPVGQAALNVAMRFAHGGGGSAGAGPGSGIDGPGLVQGAYEQEGINLPPVAAEQFDVGMPVSLHDLRPGDAVFFSDSSGYVNHAALYAGNGQIVSATEAGDHVKVYSLSDSPFAGHFMGARRYTAAALADPKHYARTLPTIKG